MNQIPNIEEVVEQFMMTWFRPAYFEALTPTNRQEQVIYDEAKLKWETCKQQLTETLHQQLQKARYCGKEFADGSICRVKLDCHLHDWRQREEIQKARQDRLREEIVRLEGMKTNYVQGMENGLLHHREPCQCQTCVDKRNDTLTSIITRYKEELLEL